MCILFSLGIFVFANYCVMPSEGECNANSVGSVDLVANATVNMPVPLSKYTYPNTLKLYRNMTCVWNITAPVGHLVRISLRYLRMRYQRGHTCSRDSVAIFDGPSEASKRVLQKCSAPDTPFSQTKMTFISTGRSMSLSLKTGLSSKGSSFLFLYQAIQPTPALSSACNTSEYTTVWIPTDDEAMSIASPNYPGKAPVGTVCKWNITAPKFHLVKLWFLKVPVNCDGIKVFDQTNMYNPANGKLNCSSVNPITVYSSRHYLSVEYTATNMNEGFLSYLVAVKTPPFVFSCSIERNEWTLGNSTGVLASFDYPHAYPKNARCRWNIKVQQHQLIKLTFKTFSLQYSKNCEKDYLKMLNKRFDRKTLGTFCGSVVPRPVVSSTNEMYLEFHSDYSTNSSSGFEAVYEAINDTLWGDCSSSGAHLTGMFGTFFTPRYPKPFPSQVDCLWKITVPPNHHVRLSFHQLFDLGHCSSFNLTISEGVNDTRSRVESYCGYTKPPVLYSNGRQFWVHFKSNYKFTHHREGFHAEYEAVKSLPDSAACSYDGKPRYLKAPTGVIASEGFPNSYSNNIECGFAIWVSGGDLKGVTLTFESFHLEPSHNCSSDYVEVFDGMGDHSRSLGRFCGNEIPSPVSTTEKGFLHHMYVKFISNSRGRYPGFKASYKATLGMKPGVLVMIILLSIFGGIVIITVIGYLCWKKILKHRSAGYSSTAVRVPSEDSKL